MNIQHQPSQQKHAQHSQQLCNCADKINPKFRTYLWRELPKQEFALCARSNPYYTHILLQLCTLQFATKDDKYSRYEDHIFASTCGKVLALKPHHFKHKCFRWFRWRKLFAHGHILRRTGIYQNVLLCAEAVIISNINRLYGGEYAEFPHQ